MKTLVEKGLEETVGYWADLRTAYDWVHRATRLLNNTRQLDVLVLRREYRQLLSEIISVRNLSESESLLGEASRQFCKVSRSYWNGLFGSYQVRGLPRTNNDLEQQFGSYRHHERRCTGRKVASAMTVVRGPVRLVAALSTPARVFEGWELRPRCLVKWYDLRQQIQTGQEERVQQRRFRRDPGAFLAQLEQRLLKAILPT